MNGEGAFITVDDFEAAWRPLSIAERSNADYLLTSAGQWIRDEYLKFHGVAIADDHAGALAVSIDVVRTAMETGKYAGHLNYGRTEGPRAKSGSLATPGGSLAFTDWHKEQLGIPTRPRPAWCFGGIDHDARY